MGLGWRAADTANVAARTATTRPVKVLFIGSSYTMYNRMIGMVAALSRAGTPTRPLRCQQVIVGGSSLKDHWDSATSMRKLRDGKWDVVVLQGHHYVYRGTRRRQQLLEYGAKLAELREKLTAVERNLAEVGG